MLWGYVMYAPMLCYNASIQLNEREDMLVSETFAICGEGEANLTHELQTVVLYGAEVKFPLYFRVCSHCKSDYAGNEESELNKKAMLEARSGVINQINERKNMQPNKIIITEDTSDTQAVSPSDFIKQLSYAMRFADAGLSEKQVVTMSMYLKARLS